MKFVYYFYIAMIVLTQATSVVRSSVDFEDVELKYLSRKLNPIECLRLLEAMYLKKPMTDDEFAQSETKIPLEDESLLRRQLERPFLSHENCRVKLEELIHNLPENSNRWTRVSMETALRSLGRPDLAQYIKRNRRFVQYYDEVSRNSRNVDKHHSATGSMVSKIVQVTPDGRKFKDPPKEAVVQVYRTPEVSKATKGKSIQSEVQGAHMVRSQRTDDDDSRTRWTAFLILLGLVALTVLGTVFFALYKQKRRRIFRKSCDDRCPLADGFGGKPSTTDIDVEKGASASCSPCGRRKKRLSSAPEPSPSPSSICPRETGVTTRKPKRKKHLKDKQQKSEKRRRRRCDKKCCAVTAKKEPTMVDKSTKTRDTKVSEKCQFTDPPKPRLNLKEFHEKIANILRKGDTNCKCCKCNIADEKSSTKKNVCCTDNKCQKFRLKNIAELCLSADDRCDNSKKETKRRRKEKEREKDTDKEKESEKTSPENSARSKDKRESKMKEKRAKKGRCNADDVCGRKTCRFRKSRDEKTLGVDDK